METIISGVFVRLEIHIDKQSVSNDGFALGACMCDLEREGWMLDSFGAGDDGGVTAVLLRSWRVGIPPHGMANLAATIGTEAEELTRRDSG